MRPSLDHESSAELLAEQRARTRAWYERHGQPVTVVIPSYRDADLVGTLVDSIRTTTDRDAAQIVVADDASGAEHVAKLRRLEGVNVVAGERNRGFAANANRGLAAVGDEHDVVIVNSDVVAEPGWLEALQSTAHSAADVGIVGPRLLYPNGLIQSAGSTYVPADRGRIQHRYHGRPADWPPACVAWPALAVTGACMYIRREALACVGTFDEGYLMAYEDVDLCLRTWQAGLRVLYEPAAVLRHIGSATRGQLETPQERLAQRRFWTRWSEFLGVRSVRPPAGALRVDVLLEPGGPALLSAALDRLAQAGHEVAYHGPVDDPIEFAATLADRHSLKLASGPKTALAAWLATVRNGVAVYLLTDEELCARPFAPVWEREEFRYLALGESAYEHLRAAKLDCWPLPAEPYDDALEDALMAAAQPRSLLMARELQILRAELTACQYSHREMQESLSWRLTAWLRWLKASTRALRRGR